MKTGEVIDIVKLDEVDSRRAITYRQAMELELPVKDYRYKDLPVGEVNARLDFKIWGKFNNLELFFTDLANDEKIKISVFNTNGYRDRDGLQDFSESYLNGEKFKLNIGTTAKGNFSLLSAVLVDET